MARKKRVHGTPSSSMPPIDAPTWTVSIEWRGIYVRTFHFIFCVFLLLLFWPFVTLG